MPTSTTPRRRSPHSTPRPTSSSAAASAPSALGSRSLRSHPVVVNNWASWCGPCQSEFPVFQKVSASLGRQVAFVGIDGKDANPSAAAFLRRFPVSYPSYVDPSATIASAELITAAYPETAFYDRTGHRVFVHAGPYLTPSELLRDIRLYVLR